jgi:hypothetical protein
VDTIKVDGNLVPIGQQMRLNLVSNGVLARDSKKGPDIGTMLVGAR